MLSSGAPRPRRHDGPVYFDFANILVFFVVAIGFVFMNLGLAWLLREAFAAAPGLVGCRFLRAWAGLRPATADGLPVVGPWPGAPGLFVATGHFRSGILLTPVTARLIRDHVVDGRSALPGAALLPDRLAGR